MSRLEKAAYAAVILTCALVIGNLARNYYQGWPDSPRARFGSGNREALAASSAHFQRLDAP